MVSSASRVWRSSAASCPAFSLNLPIPLPASAKPLPALRPFTIGLPISFAPGARRAPSATPPARPASAAPPASAGHLAFSPAEEIALPVVLAPSAAASLPFEASCFAVSTGLPEPPEPFRLRLRVLAERELDCDWDELLPPFERPRVEVRLPVLPLRLLLVPPLDRRVLPPLDRRVVPPELLVLPLERFFVVL